VNLELLEHPVHKENAVKLALPDLPVNLAHQVPEVNLDNVASPDNVVN